ncbi:MAG: metallophosphoesterase family protein [Candidatus Ventricola sp.]
MKNAILWMLCLVLTMLCAHAPAQQDAWRDGKTEALRIAAATDLHVNPTLRYTNVVNPLEPFHLQIVDAFLWDAGQRGTDVILLLGDNTNQGRLTQHEALVEKLRAAEENGMTVLVLPGNHDIGEVSPDQFAELYADFGYGEAFSRDSTSLSYSVLRGRQMFLMLDTNGYDNLMSSAYLTDETLSWARQQLDSARQMGCQVIAAGHYPLCTSHSTEFVGKEKAIRLLEEYGVQLYLCGHLHKRCVTVQGNLTELVVDQTISYPCCYADLTADSGVVYQPHSIDVSAWASQFAADSPDLLQFDAYQRRLEQERCCMIVEKLKQDQSISREDQRLAEDFFFQMMDYRAHGTLSRYADALKAHPGCKIMVRLGEGTIYSRWIPSVLSDAVPYTTGFMLRDGKLYVMGEE